MFSLCCWEWYPRQWKRTLVGARLHEKDPPKESTVIPYVLTFYIFYVDFFLSILSNLKYIFRGSTKIAHVIPLECQVS